jgi:hypothetical protein
MRRGRRRWLQAVCMCGAFCLVPNISAQQESQVGIAKVTQDRVEIRHQADRLVVDVYHARGIGRAELSAPRDGWPPALLVRLHGFPELESFTASSKSAKLECALLRLEGGQPVQFCKLDGAPVDALSHEGDYFEAELPRTLFAPGAGPIAVQWVDQWR